MSESQIAFPAAEHRPVDEQGRANGLRWKPLTAVQRFAARPARSLRRGASASAVVVVCAASGLVLSLALLWAQPHDQSAATAVARTGLQGLATSTAKSPPGNVGSSASTGGSQQHPVTIRRPTGPPRAEVGLTGAPGEKLEVACSTCHRTRAPNRENKSTADLDEFHKGMSLAHGTLSCLACHNAQDYDSLQLADGTRVEFEDVMTLCSQCHGTQRRDYDHGAHGGMTGHWDLSRGPRVRNNCVDCHHPHQPKFPKMNPTFKPRDRFLEPHDGDRHE